MRPIRTIFGLLLGILTLGTIASVIGALVMRRQLASSGGETDDEFDLVTIFDSVEFRSTAPQLRRGSSLTWYGGGTIDLRGASLDPTGADLGIRAIFGGLRLVVPATWRVETDVTAMFGGLADVRDQDLVETDAPVLHVRGFAVFGGVAIMSDAPDLDALSGEGEATAAAPA
jgi:hypothetical protein